jgi:hypothetical protein
MANIDDGDEFVSQGDLEIDEADRLLPRLKNDGIRFEIAMKEIPQFQGKNLGPRPPVAMITLFVHPSDLDAWLKIRNELYPV